MGQLTDRFLIMLVDDEQTNIDLFATILEDAGYRTIGATTADGALKLLESNKPDLIISDISMPEMSGFEFYEKVQKIPELRTVPFIFLTALSDRRHMIEGKELGVDDYLTKPVDIDELVTTVRGKLRRAASLRSAMQDEFETLKSQILATLSHELNTPLTSIIGFSEIISSDASKITTEELKEFAELIHHGGDRLKNLVDDFLEAVQIDSGQIESYYKSNKGEFSLSNVLKSLYDEYYPLAVQNSLKLEFAISDDLIGFGSETLTRDMLGRIISNAIKFTSSGVISIEAKRENDCTRIVIQDTGVGIPESEIDRVFEKFYQVEKERQQQQGAGLGLYIAKKIAEISNFKFTLKSTVNVGTTVIVEIPVRG